jgi:hypothetical protein
MNPDRFDLFTKQLAALDHRRALVKGALATIAFTA